MCHVSCVKRLQEIKIIIICHFRIGVGQHNPGHIFSWLLHPVNIIPPCSSVSLTVWSSHFSRTDTINLPPWPILSASSNYWNRDPKRRRHQVFHSQTFSVNFVCFFFCSCRSLESLGFLHYSHHLAMAAGHRTHLTLLNWSTVLMNCYNNSNEVQNNELTSRRSEYWTNMTAMR